ncbi:hypothetical protein PFISCL1PPCAC_6865 [Pristionchus fissidentatus]|uniref:Centrosomal protein CEP104 N-terminal domain-containing protein n=1 Tax=Pristionchus fissidentatus TaxID=1538716 RepID=A0AAV5VBH5_9BILA|nr:hypothetical protein PFISCL1PPCAC_6865 [Pristionchus fissidentatus]
MAKRNTRVSSARKSTYKDEVALEEIPWSPIVVGNEDPNVFTSSQGWMSQPGSRFPLDIVIGLKQLANIYKVVVDVHNDIYPTSIDISIGRGHTGERVDYDGARRANYGGKGEMHFKTRDRTRMESRTFFADHVGNYIWLVLQRPHRSPGNPHEQVGIDRVVVLGYPMNDGEGDTMNSRKVQRSRASSEGERSCIRKSSARAEPVQQRAPTAPQRRPSPLPRPPRERPASVKKDGMGDGMRMTGDHLATDPLSTLRMVKRVLMTKMESAQERGFDVEANTCRRAIQRLDEYEARMEDLDERRSDALIHNDQAEAHRISNTMADCRDTCFRSIHVDLLLSKSELRSIGVASAWANE